jgi:vacuolar protein sorting-associated protein 35
MPIQDIVALHTVVLNLAAKCYPERIDYVDKVLEITEAIFNNMNLDQLVAFFYRSLFVLAKIKI